MLIYVSITLAKREDSVAQEGVMINFAPVLVGAG